MKPNEFVDRVLSPYDQASAQKVIDAWYQGLLDDMLAQRDTYREIASANTDSAELWGLFEQFWQAQADGDEERAAEINAACAQFDEQHPEATDRLVDVYLKHPTVSIDELDAAFHCLYGEP